MNSLLFGTGGIPMSTIPRDLNNGLKQINSLNLDALELEFVQSIFIKKEKTAEK